MSDDDNWPDCPWCEAEIEMHLGFDNLGSDFRCPHCQKWCEVEGDYISIDAGWYFTIIRGTPES
jgi:hypothetical protein